MVNILATVQARYLPMMAPFISTEEARYYLTGVHIEPHHEGGALLIATDGHRMAVIHDREGTVAEPGTFPLPPALLREDIDIADMAEFDGKLVTVRAEIQNTFVGLSQIIDGQFPDWRRVFPKGEPRHKEWCFNPEYLVGFKTAAAGQHVHVTGYGDREPVVIRPFAMPEFVGLLMPVSNQDDALHGIPDWVLRPKVSA